MKLAIVAQPKAFFVKSTLDKKNEQRLLQLKVFIGYSVT